MFVVDQLKRSDFSLRLLALGVLLAMLALLGRLWFVQMVSAQHYQESIKDQSFRTVRIPAIRGKILDRQGTVLAEDRANYNISLYLNELREPSKLAFEQLRKEWNDRNRNRSTGKPRTITRAEREGLERSARFVAASNSVLQLSRILQVPIPLDEAQFYRHFVARRVLPFPILRNLSSLQVTRFEEYPTPPPGLDLEVQPVRTYPQNQTASHLVGHLVYDDSSSVDEDAFFDYRLQDYRGVVGLELAYDLELRGRAGVKNVQINRIGYPQSENVWNQAKPGRNLVLTLDHSIQLAAENALRTGPFGVNTRGAIVVVDVTNGDVLALASNPGFDPNIFLRRLTTQEVAALNDTKLTPQINRATQGIYPPGSIFKIVSGLAALESGTCNPREMYQNPGFYKLSARSRPIDDLAPAGLYDFRRAFIKSSNSYFIEYGLKAGWERVFDMGHRFFIGQSTGLPTRQDSAGIFPSVETIRSRRATGAWTDGNTANVCIGQEIAVTPLQMALMTAAVANGGKVFWPRLVQRLETPAGYPEGGEAELVAPRVRGELGVNPRHLQLIRDVMVGDVEDPDGTGFAPFKELDRVTPRLGAYRVGGKTGTAQVKKGSQTIDHITWFTSFGPYETPRYAVVAMVESGSSGGATAAPMVVKVYKALKSLENNPVKSRFQPLAQL